MIKGKRVLLRAIEDNDISSIVDWRNDPEIYKFFYEHEPLSLTAQKIWLEKHMSHQDERMWIIEVIDSSSAVGTVGLVDIDWRNRKAEWGRFFIGSPLYYGKGYGSEVEAIILRYFFDHMNMNRLQCTVFTDNTNVIDLHNKFGFKQEGLYKQYIFKDGVYHDVVYLAMLREDYLSGATQARISKYLD